MIKPAAPRTRHAVQMLALCNDGKWRRRMIVGRSRPNLWGARHEVPKHAHEINSTKAPVQP